MRKLPLALAVGAVVFIVGGQAAWGCGGLVAPNGAVRLVKTTTLATYHDGVEHYVTSFQFQGFGTKFGSIVPLPGVPTSVSEGGGWTLQRLEREVNPPEFGVNRSVALSAAGSATVVLQTRVGALDITVLRGGGRAVVDWVRSRGFAVSTDAPGVLDFYARRSPIFLAATYDPAAALSRGLGVGDGTPVQVAIPVANPWVPLRILALGKDKEDVVQADVFLLTDHQPTVLTGPGVSFGRSEQAPAQLLDDLRADKNMGWIPGHGWLSYLKVQSPARQLGYDMAIDASGTHRPSAVAAGLSSDDRIARLLPSTHLSPWAWTAMALLGAGLLAALELTRRRGRALGY
jgi:hypothetical protein